MEMPMPVYTGGYQKMTQIRFLGYDALGSEGAICDMENLTSDHWPELATRVKRRFVRQLATPQGLGERSGMFWVDGGKFFYKGVQYGPDDFLLPGKKCFAAMGDYIVIFPDKKYFNIRDDGYGSLEAYLSFENACFSDWEGDMSTVGNAIVREDGGFSMFREGDAVTIRGCTKHPNNNKSALIRGMAGQVLLFTDDTFEREKELKYTVGGDGLPAGTYSPDALINDKYWWFEVLEDVPEGGSITIDVATEAVIINYLTHQEETKLIVGKYGELLTFQEYNVSYYEDGPIEIIRQTPALDFVFEHNNRLFGCAGDTIYASKLGDIFNWEVYDGTASDSWTTETGSPGEFTGGCSYGGYPRFFKENLIYTLYGDYPAAYQLQKYECLGVANGSRDSIALVNGRLYYLSRRGPCVYAGGLPSLIADGFGIERYEYGHGGSDGTKYYLSMSNSAGEWHLFVYDTQKGLWMREDDTRALSFAQYKGTLYCLTTAGALIAMGRSSEEEGTEEDTLPWYAEFGDFAESAPDKKRAGKLQIRAEMEEGSCLKVLVMYDSAGEWEEIARIDAGEKRSFVLPVIPRRVDHYRLRLEGEGGCRIFSIARQVAAGSER